MSAPTRTCARWCLSEHDEDHRDRAVHHGPKAVITDQYGIEVSATIWQIEGQAPLLALNNALLTADQAEEIAKALEMRAIIMRAAEAIDR